MTRKIECDGCGMQEDTYWHGDMPLQWFRLERDQRVLNLSSVPGPWHFHDWDCLVRFSTDQSINQFRRRVKGEPGQKDREGPLRRALRGRGRDQG
jgi:hypothetical protein